MKRIVIAGLALLFSIGIACAQDQAPTRVELLVPGADLVPNANVRSGDEFWGLFLTRTGYVLAPTEIRVQTCSNWQGRSVRRVHAKSETQPLFLIAGALDLKKGMVKTAFTGEKFLFPGESLVLPGDEDPCCKESYVLKAYGNVVENFKQNLIYDYATQITSGDLSQVLDYYKSPQESAKTRPTKFAVLNVTDHLVKSDLAKQKELPILIWSGDLDNDEKLDFFMWWPCPGKGAGVYSLFLSSPAKPGNLVKKISVGVRVPKNSAE
jgi:hypothetical protein